MGKKTMKRCILTFTTRIIIPINLNLPGGRSNIYLVKNLCLGGIWYNFNDKASLLGHGCHWICHARGEHQLNCQNTIPQWKFLENMTKTMKHIGNGAGDMTCETSCFNTWPTFIVRLGHSQPDKLSNFKQIPLLQFPCDRGGMSCHMRSLPWIYSKTGDHVFKWSSNHSSRENWKLIHDQSVNRREAATFWVRCLCPAYGNKAGYKGKFMAWHRDLPWSLTKSEWNLGPWACQRTMFNSLYI